MNTRQLLLGMSALLGATGLLWAGAQTPAPLPPPVIMGPRVQPAKTTPAATAAPAKPAVVWCPACRGRKTVGAEVEGACRSCNGTGKTISGFAKTESTCTFCKGGGKVMSIVAQPCATCQSKGVLDAAYFEQFVGCTNCNGTKILEEETTLKCSACGGAGKMVKTSGISLNSKGGKSGGKGFGSSLGASSSAEQACPFCSATGTITKRVQKPCATCFGAGVVPPPPPPPPAPSSGG